MIRSLWMSATGFVLSLVAVSATNAGFINVDFSDQANFTWSGVSNVPGEGSAVRLPGAPTGVVTLGGIPFNITSNSSGNQAWHGDIAAAGGSGTMSMTMNTGTYGATTVYTLINSWKGQPGPASYAQLVFTGTGGASYTYNLVGNVDIRDYNNDGWTDTINGTTTTNAFNDSTDNWGMAGRLDMQQIALPSSFADQTLTSIELIDNGGPNTQRVVLDGVTVQTASVPEPSSFILLGIVAAGAIGYAWRRRQTVAA